MLAHQFSLSKPPDKPLSKVGKQKILRDTIEAAVRFIFVNLGEWCLVGTYSAKAYGSRKYAYNRAKYYQERLETAIAEKLNYHADLYPVTWALTYNKAKATYEVRVLVQYEPKYAYNEDQESPWVEQVQYEAFAERVGKQIAESNDAAHYEMTGVERKQSNALKTAMDSLFFGRQS